MTGDRIQGVLCIGCGKSFDPGDAKDFARHVAHLDGSSSPRDEEARRAASLKGAVTLAGHLAYGLTTVLWLAPAVEGGRRWFLLAVAALNAVGAFSGLVLLLKARRPGGAS